MFADESFLALSSIGHYCRFMQLYLPFAPHRSYTARVAAMEHKAQHLSLRESFADLSDKKFTYIFVGGSVRTHDKANNTDN